MQYVLEQYVTEVSEFSSQYGSVGSISYVAQNLIDRPALYPEYGDFSASYSMKTYGLWWKICPSAQPYVEDSCPLLSPAVDFVDLKFEIAVHPIRVDIYETYNPGSVIRVWCSTDGKGWLLLWSGTAGTQPALARIFSPPIFQSDKFINMLRIEFDQRCQDYYSALDAVVLVGATHTSSPSKFQPKSISSCIHNMGLLETPISEESVLSGIAYILSKDLKNLEWSLMSTTDFVDEDQNSKKVQREQMEENEELVIVDLHDGSVLSPESFADKELEGGYFSVLPEELVLHILKQVGIQSLCRLACTCRLMRTYISQSILYQHLNLKNSWWLVTNGTLEWLTPRCQQLKALDLSWCGNYDVISSQSFMEFMHQRGYNLTVLHVSNCQFIDNYCLYIVANSCSNLEVLSLAACLKIDHLGFGELKKLNKMRYLDLSQTGIEFRNLHILLQHFGDLNHLLLHNCTALDIDEVALTLATFNPRLISLGAWKTWPLTSRGVRALACLKTLQELDLGWSLSGTVTEALSELLQACPDLRKLFLTALRTLTDQDVNLIATHGKNLEQLDLMGTRNISPESVFNLLMHCEALQLLDVSYCEQIHHSIIQQWSVQFPKVAIKGGLRHQVRLI